MERHTLNSESGCENALSHFFWVHVLGPISWMLTVYNRIITASVDGQEDLWLGFDSEYLLLLAE